MRKSTIEIKLNQYLETFIKELEKEDFEDVVDGMVSLHKMPLSISMENYIIHFSFDLGEECIEVFDKLCNFERKLELDKELEKENYSYQKNIKAIKEAVKTGIGRAEFGTVAIKSNICKFNCMKQEKSIVEFNKGYELYELAFNKFFFGVLTSIEDYKNRFEEFKFKIADIDVIDLYTIIYRMM